MNKLNKNIFIFFLQFQILLNNKLVYNLVNYKINKKYCYIIIIISYI